MGFENMRNIHKEFQQKIFLSGFDKIPEEEFYRNFLRN